MLTTVIDALQVRIDKRERLLLPVLLAATFLLALWLRTLHLTDIASRTPDEHVYTGYARELVSGGLGAYRGVFQRYLSEPGQWIYPGPSRIANVLLFAGVMKVTGAMSAQAGACVSWLLSMASVLLLARLGRRFVGGLVGVLAAFFLATYVVEIEFARRAWGESTATFVTLLLVYAACALDREPSSRRWTVGFFAAGAVCMLAKETSIFAYGLVGVWLCARQVWVAGNPARALRWVAFGAASAGLAFGVLALLAGSAGTALAALLNVFSNGGLGTNGWGARYASGPWYQFFHLLGLISPVTAAAVVVGAAVVIMPRWSRALLGTEPGARACGSLALVLTFGLIAACAFGPNLQYMRLMAPADPSYCLLAAIGLGALVRLCSEVPRSGIRALLLCSWPVLLGLGCSRDYTLFERIVVATGVGDFSGRGFIALYEEHRLQQPKLDSARQALAPSARPTPAAPAPPVNHLTRSLELCRETRWAECLAAAHAVLREDPRHAAAWNNAAIGYAGLRLWDDAVRAAEQAVQLDANFPLARRNLAWVTRERAKQIASMQ